MMAMTKKEKAAFDALLLRAETLAALRWTGPVAFDVPAPGYDDGYRTGFDISGNPAWSNSITHGSGPCPSAGDYYRSASQKPAAMFSTRLLALKALRHETEKRCAADLLKIDRQISEAEAEEGATE